MNHTYRFKNVDYYNSGRRNTKVEVRVSLEVKPIQTKQIDDTRTECECLSIHATGDFEKLMTFKELNTDPAFCKLHEMWKKYDWNGYHAGSPIQEKALNEAVEKGILESADASNHDNCCAYLSSIGLLFDNDFLVCENGKEVPYKYGSGWISQSIPIEDLEECKAIAKGSLKPQNNKKEIER